MKELMFHDKALNRAVPARILVIGGSGKKTFCKLMKQHDDRLEYFTFSDEAPNGELPPVMVDIVNEDVYMQLRAMNFFTHVFYVDRGGVSAQDDNSPVSFNPHEMILVDNSLGLDHLEEEAGYCVSLMNLLVEAE